MKSDFGSDFKYLVTQVTQTNRLYLSNDHGFLSNIKKLRGIIQKFNLKYHLVEAAVSKTFDAVTLKLFLRKEGVDGLFRELESDKKLKNNIFQKDEVLPLIALKHDRNRNMVELIYRKDTLEDKNSPEFRLIAHYALKSVDETIEIKEPAANPTKINPVVD